MLPMLQLLREISELRTPEEHVSRNPFARGRIWADLGMKEVNNKGAVGSKLVILHGNGGVSGDCLMFWEGGGESLGELSLEKGVAKQTLRMRSFLTCRATLPKVPVRKYHH